MQADITDAAAHELCAAIRDRRLSCRELMRSTLARIAVTNPRHNAIVSLRDEAELLREADARDVQITAGTTLGPLHGLPMAVKDMAATAGLRTTMGSPLLHDHVPQRDGLMVERLKAAGCIVIGKTNTPEFGLGSHTFNPVFGITRNAFDPGKSAGGSSGGAAVALALRMVALVDGSDTMGSLRNPAGWNNVCGLRPSQGRVPMWPAADVWVTQFGTEGPMARSVRDLALLLDVQAGFDARSPLSMAGRERFDGDLGGVDAKRLRIGWLGDLGGHLSMEPGVLATCEAALARFASLGAAVEPVAPGFAPEAAWQTWLTWRHWLVAGRIEPFLRNPANRAHIKPEALWEHDAGQSLTGVQTMAASVARTAYYQQVLAMFDRHDVLALPTAQVWPFDAALRWPSAIDGRAMDTYHRWMEVTIYATLAGLPCIALPAGFGAAGLPMGLQLIGRPHAEMHLLRIAQAYETASPAVLSVRPPEPAATPSTAP
ncbi:MAG: amidase [Burkholderiaceae bacterium]